MSQFDKFNNTTNTYIPDNTSLRIKDKNKELDLNLPKKDYNLKGDFISYSWNKGDTLSLKFSVNKEITVENNALIFEISGESPSSTEGYLHQRAYNLVDIKSWTCNAISEEFGSSWIEDKVFTYPSIGSVTHLIPDMNGKSLLGEILNFRQEVIYAQQFDNVNEAEIEINKELSEKLTTGIYYCRASVVAENTSYMYKQYMIHVTVADDGEEKKLDVCEYERVVPNNSDIIVDSELSPVSLNPVQNKVIYYALQNLGAVKSISINGEELYFPDEFGNVDLEIKSHGYIDLTGYATENWVSLNFTSNNDFTQTINDVQSEIDNIDEKIPTQASSSNQLADKNFVNSSIENVAAFYITKDALGNPFTSKAELDNATVYYSGGAIRVPTRNDYVIVQYDESKMSPETGEKPTTRYLYDNGWNFQYIVNNSGLTAAQLATLNSGLTSEDKDTIDSIPDMYYNKTQVDNLLDDKQDKLISGENIKTINSQSILGEGNISIKTYSPFPDDFITDGTLEQVADSMVSSTGAIKGMAYLGQIKGDCLPFDDIIAECKVEFMADGLALLTVSSSDVIPYHWEYNTYAGDYIWKRFSYVLPNPTNVGSQDLTSIEIDGEIFNIKTEVDQEYDSTSINAQSGVAVAQALQTVSIDAYTEEEIDTLWNEVEV